MWYQTDLWLQSATYRRYKNEDPSSEIQELLFSESNTGYFECVISFIDSEMANKFFDAYTELNPYYRNSLYIKDATGICHENDDLLYTNVGFYLTRQKALDLDKICQLLTGYRDPFPDEVFTIIKSNGRELTELEKDFYCLLDRLDQNNFQLLLSMARNILTDDTRHANVLWELATACKELLLIEEWIETLKCIIPYSNYYKKAQAELAHFTLFEFGDIQQKDLEQQKRSLMDGIQYSLGMEKDGIDFIKKMTLTFLQKNWQEQELMFPTKTYNDDKQDSEEGDNKSENGIGLIFDLIVYARSLQKENLQLKQQVENVTDNSSKMSSPRQSKPTLRL